MLILLIFAFLAGVVTVLSPCILPVLPIVLSGSVAGGKRRPIGVVTGFVVSFTFFTLFLSTIVQATGVSADILRTCSVVVIVGFGLSLLIPQVQGLLERLFTVFSRLSPSGQHDGFWGGMVVGLSLGLIWTPCVGPILASVISLALTGSVSGAAVFITLAYSLGTAGPMLAIVYGGRQLLQRVPWLLSNTATIQKAFGVVMVLTGMAIFFNIDRRFQTWVLEAFPQYGAGLTRIEENQAVQQQLDKLHGQPTEPETHGQPLYKMQESMNYPDAPDFIGGTNWVSTEPLLLADQLKGKVVLVDFWTYSCINCIRTLPFVTKWYETYKDQGFVIVGVHAPEFEFEKKTDNVVKAMEDFGITYPVVQDNDFKIWRAYNNRYWPAHYLIDKNGKIRYTHFGEGKYTETENKIRELLGEEPLESSEEEVSERFRPQTPETYLGYQRAEQYVRSAVGEIVPDEQREYRGTADSLPIHGVSLRGRWTVEAERILAGSDSSTLDVHFVAGKVHLVLAPPEGGTGSVHVLMDGKPLAAEFRTADMNDAGVITVSEPRKYDLANFMGKHTEGTLSLVLSEGTSAYAFTFGQ